MSRHHGRRRGQFYGCAHNWKRGPAICSGPQAREALQALLVDRVDGTFGGLLAASTWPTTFGGPNGTPSLVAGLLTFPFVGEARVA